jgi:DhnA family fructose-bisphosphate aldolase class Ia
LDSSQRELTGLVAFSWQEIGERVPFCLKLSSMTLVTTPDDMQSLVVHEARSTKLAIEKF